MPTGILMCPFTKASFSCGMNIFDLDEGVWWRALKPFLHCCLFAVFKCFE